MSFFEGGGGEANIKGDRNVICEDQYEIHSFRNLPIN